MINMHDKEHRLATLLQREWRQRMKAKEKMVAATKAVKAANVSIQREMAVITLQDRMEMLPDAQTKYDLATAIKELEVTLKQLRKY